jgi:hypothetical protein
MPLTLILPALWFAVMLLLVAMCAMAARGDRTLRGEGAENSRWDRLEDELLGPWGARARLSPSPYRAYRLRVGRALQPAASHHVGNRAQQDLDVRPQ